MTDQVDDLEQCVRHSCKRKEVELRGSIQAMEEGVEKLAQKWEKIAKEHGVRQFTGNDHKLFANELRAALQLIARRKPDVRTEK